MTKLQPLRLVRGSHPAGHGVGCVMNLMCWEQGMTSGINDNPEGYTQVVRMILINLNDTYCQHASKAVIHTDGGAVGDVLRTVEFICPECSMKMVDLAHLLAGSEKVFTLCSQEQERKLHQQINAIYMQLIDLRRFGPSPYRYSVLDRLIDIFTKSYTEVVQSLDLTLTTHPVALDEAITRMLASAR